MPRSVIYDDPKCRAAFEEFGALPDDRAVVAAVDGCHVARVFVPPDHQGAGCGTAIMDALEGLASASYGTVMLDSSVPAEQFYRNRGYQDVSEGVWEIESRGALPAATLTYKIMEKRHG